jgi:pyruvate formate lyase activating enzyme
LRLLTFLRKIGLITSVMEECKICERPASGTLGYCVECIRKGRLDLPLQAHSSTRRRLGLPETPPKGEGIRCPTCSNECVIPEGGKGYCGIWRMESGKLRPYQQHGRGLLYHYLDPHVTNCCASYFCPAGTGVGYPEFAYRKGPELGYYNFAIFFYGCNFDCLFCQNYSHKLLSSGKVHTPEELAEEGTLKGISCWCFFGGSPEPQLAFAIKAASLARKMKEGILRICWEWNGCGNQSLVDRAGELSYESGGVVKFDLKAWSPDLSLALSGVSNRRAYENFERLARRFPIEKGRPPTVTATTLLVPYYVDSYEVGRIAEFIASIDPNIPYSLLVFHPSYVLTDLPVTPKRQVKECVEAAKRHLKRVHIGNIFLLS